ncbi:MAG: hypothetical protein ACI8X3_001574, partial [Saprospiraceae bacterium]
VFTAIPSAEGVAFTNTFSANYLLSSDVEDNIAERFIWNTADFDAPTNVSYDLQASLSSTLENFDLIGTTTETNLSVTVKQLLDYADDLELDDDPNTTDLDGNPNNAGTLYFRVRAYAGAGTGNNTEMLSAIISLNIEIVEKVATGSCEGVFALGDALVDAQWDWSTALSFPCESDVIQAKVNLTAGTFRFFTEEFEWASGLNYPYYIAEGYTIDAGFEDAMDGDNNFKFIGTPGIYDLVINGNAKTISLAPSGPLWLVGDATPGGWDWAGPTVAAESSLNIWSATLVFSSGAFRFFTVEGDWASGLNYPYYEGEGYTIDANFENAVDGDSNFKFIGTPGTYTVTVNAVDKTITLD